MTPGVSVILVGHGSSSDRLAARPVRAAAALLRKRRAFAEVRAAFWKSLPRAADALVRARGPVVLLVPWFLSDGWFSRRAIPAGLGLRGRVTRRGEKLLIYADPVGTHPGMEGAVLRCAAAALRTGRTPPPPKRETTLVVVGHGTPRDPRSARAVLAVAARLRRRRAWAAVIPAFLDQEPSARGVLARVKTRYAVIVPFFASDGPHSRRDLPRLMGLLRRNGGMNPNPVRVAGLDGAWYARAVGTGPWMLRVTLDRAREALRWAAFMSTRVGLRSRSRAGSHG